MSLLRARVVETLEKMPEASSEEVAEAVVDDSLSREAFVEIVRTEVLSVRRDQVRAVERRVFNDIMESSRKRAEANEKTAAESGVDFSSVAAQQRFQDLRRKAFSLGNGKVVEWGKATVEEHEIRVSFLEKFRAGVDRTIDQHRTAIKALLDNGVDCLDDIPEEELGDDLVEGPEITD